MVTLDLDALLSPVSLASPCGEDLEYDPGFLSMMAAARGAPQERLVGPNAPTEETNWPNVSRQATALFTRTKDVRVASALTKAQLRIAGLDGFGSGIKLLRSMLERYWDAVHPILDVSDSDATMRINALRELCDRQGVLNYLRSMPLVQVPTLGSFSFKDLTVASVDTAIGSAAPENSKVERAFANCDVSHLRGSVSALQYAIEDLQGIESCVTDKLGAGQSVSFDELTTVLEELQRLLAMRLAQREPHALEATVALGGRGAQALGMNDNTSSARLTTSGEVRSRADVQHLLDLLCSYYANHEPSSPVPLLLRRARRLSEMSFMEIVRDLAPGGTADVELIRGRDGTDNT